MGPLAPQGNRDQLLVGTGGPQGDPAAAMPIFLEAGGTPEASEPQTDLQERGSGGFVKIYRKLAF